MHHPGGNNPGECIWESGMLALPEVTKTSYKCCGAFLRTKDPHHSALVHSHSLMVMPKRTARPAASPCPVLPTRRSTMTSTRHTTSTRRWPTRSTRTSTRSTRTSKHVLPLGLSPGTAHGPAHGLAFVGFTSTNTCAVMRPASHPHTAIHMCLWIVNSLRKSLCRDPCHSTGPLHQWVVAHAPLQSCSACVMNPF
jgi:hypothetical protein